MLWLIKFIYLVEFTYSNGLIHYLLGSFIRSWLNMIIITIFQSYFRLVAWETVVLEDLVPLLWEFNITILIGRTGGIYRAHGGLAKLRVT